MNRKNNINEWFRELPPDQVSPDFSSKVMKRVMSEWSLNPFKYKPIISKKAWWTISFIAIVITGILFSLHSSVTDDFQNHVETGGFNFKPLINFVEQFFTKLNNISPAFAISLLAIIALWFFDQLFSRTVKP